MLILVISLVIVVLLALAAFADRRSKKRRASFGDDRFDDGTAIAAGSTDAITRSRRSAANNGGYGVPGSGLGTGE